MAEDEQVDKVTLRVLVDKEKNKVLLAEAGKDFVDALFSFLTFPLGTIARLVAEESNIEAVKFGSLSSLYQSVKDLDPQYLWSHTCKEMLLKPRNSMQPYCWKLKLNINTTEPLNCYFFCEDNSCKIENRTCVSLFRNQTCICGKLFKKEKLMKYSIREPGFVKETSTFIVSDDLYVMPNEVGTSLDLLQKLGVNNIDAIVVDLLKLSLVSKTPLTNFIFTKQQLTNLDPRNRLEFWVGEEDEPSDDNNAEMVVKVFRRKSNEQILFVEAQEDFADFVFSFLTFPLGSVIHMFGGFSFLRCIDNLYRSMVDMSPDRCLKSEQLKFELTSPFIADQYGLKNQILRLPYHVRNFRLYKFVDPKSPISGGFSRGPLTFMVTDDLVVTPMSSISGVSYLERMKVPLNDVEERVIRIGRKEVRQCLKLEFRVRTHLHSYILILLLPDL
ncbi:hypothetical protein MtrunA17_Chr7g0241261 [Medicago truncatula]|uniref:DUF674 family protein n=1 Tax=Medicago truncatula TaxID=3880 RepID=A0A396GYY4_MEDTR|nr:hypothetical protein MtrunA17_Chr7g0241261 [Medicago truncatula]